ncbi:MAG: hypothetical protein JO345_31515 [Streptosporangiaceae bacterium]|nr:hypothetical protein [Streptosporangiaceae bacterium]
MIAQFAVHGFGRAAGLPARPDVVDGLVGREVRRHRPPLDAFLDQIADAVDDVARRHCPAGRPPRPCFDAGAGSVGSMTDG